VKRLWPSPHTVHWGYFDASLAPVAEVVPGEIIHLRSVSGAPDDAVPSGWIPPEIPGIYAEVHDRGPGGHLLTGPIAVRGARSGHVLQVDILSMTLGAPYGYNALAPLKGIFPEAIDRRDRQIIPIDRETGVATVTPGLKLPTQPFFGIIGVAPPLGWGRVDTAPPRCHGGNMDNKELVAGTTLFLPIWAEGALLSVGDGHAAQGDGEVNITAIETSLEGELRLDIRADFALTLPVAVTPSHLIAMGFDPSLDQAARIAVGSLLDLLVRFGGMAWRDAYRLASIAADLRVTQVVNGEKGIHVMLERAILDQLATPFPFFPRRPVQRAAPPLLRDA
jgi:acetamidase/formamidase